MRELAFRTLPIPRNIFGAISGMSSLLFLSGDVCSHAWLQCCSGIYPSSPLRQSIHTPDDLRYIGGYELEV